MTRTELITKHPELFAYLMGIGQVEILASDEIAEPYPSVSPFEPETVEADVILSEPTGDLVIHGAEFTAENLLFVQQNGFRLKRVCAGFGTLTVVFTAREDTE